MIGERYAVLPTAKEEHVANHAAEETDETDVMTVHADSAHATETDNVAANSAGHMNVSSDVALRDVETTADAVQDIAKEYFIERKSRATSGLQIVVTLLTGSEGIMK